MDLALYCPVCGYYEQEADKLGRSGDYYTSVNVGCLFGELLAFQFAAWLEENRAGRSQTGWLPVQIVEAGAHDGKLASDILTWLQEHRADLYAQLEYRIVEPSARRQEWQRRTLAAFGNKVRWISALTPPDGTRINGVIFCNELLDAMPSRRLGWDARARVWFEWGVALEGEQFAWARLPPQAASPAALQELIHSASLNPSPELLEILPDGFTIEVCPSAQAWWQQAARLLNSGKLVTIDYGLVADEFFAPHRGNGTIRAYHQHRISDDVLANPGLQDLTAHVNFTAIQSAGEAAGLRTESFSSQAQFLVRIAELMWRGNCGFGAGRTEQLRQFKTLTHPEYLGRSFRALVQSRQT